MGSKVIGLQNTFGKRTNPHLFVFGAWLLTLILFWSPLAALVALSLRDDRYFQAIVAPLLCVFLLYWERTDIFSHARFSPRFGVPLALLASLAWVVSKQVPAGSGGNSRVLPAVFAIILVWLALFLVGYGMQAMKSALFPLCCLFFMLPVPVASMDRITVALQYASADVSYALFRLAGVPVFRQGMTFSLAGLDFQIAPECSGIRSCLVFVIVAILLGRVFLRSGWRRWTLVMITIPIAIFKNAVRIVVISTLSAYVNRAFFFGPLHRYGGLVFISVGIAIFLPVLFALQKSETRSLAATGA